jgi:8-oxo-dGTP diphosphatase
MSDEITVVAAILWKNGRFLAVKRPEGKPLAGYWEFPGGKVEPGESLEQALARELAEELGLVVSGCTRFAGKTHAYDHAKVSLHFMRVTAWQGEPEALEGQSMAWLLPEEAAAKRFLPADAQVLRELVKGEG